MKRKTQNILFFYSMIIAPIILLLVLLMLDFTITFVIGLVLYLMVYRPLTAGFRLKNFGKFKREDFYKKFSNIEIS